jgi:hypothetical protein
MTATVPDEAPTPVASINAASGNPRITREGKARSRPDDIES